MSGTKCFTFYSYKGGSGRSVASVNTIKHLIVQMDISPKHPLLLVDADLESAGLTYFFKCENKFSDDFLESIHTTKILSSVSDTLEGVNGRVVFGSTVDTCDPLDSTLLGNLKGIFKDEFDQKMIDDLFTDIQIARTELRMFRRIVECYILREKLGWERMKSEQRKNFEIMHNYDLRKLVDQLVDVQKTNEPHTQKTERKYDILRDFLPAAKFVDISRYFDCEANTIKFLGADVKYQGEQIMRNDAADAIFQLLELCSDMGYRATVFDSGAGVQSTAHVLHSVSDVIVYCMRPTRQFIDGTRMQLYNYSELLNAVQESKNNENRTQQKTVILLPTAVPPYRNDDRLCMESFAQIQKIAELFSEFLDDTFCMPQMALNEVRLFKWREAILGTKPSKFLDKELQNALKQYESPDTMPEDARNAYQTYDLLAKRILINS